MMIDRPMHRIFPTITFLLLALFSCPPKKLAAFPFENGKPTQVQDLNACEESIQTGLFMPDGARSFVSGVFPGAGLELGILENEKITLVKDLYPGPTGQLISMLLVANHLLYFTFSHPDYGSELWRSDGTSAGTFMIKDINPGTASANIRFPQALADGRVLFSADKVGEGREFWVTDGTDAGTYMLDQLAPGPTSSSPLPVNSNGLFIAASSVAGGDALFRIDEQLRISIIKLLTPNATTSSASSAIELEKGRSIFFYSTTGSGREPWVTDGTAEGTHLLVETSSGAGSSSLVHRSTVYGSKVYLVIKDQAGLSAIWRSDGTTSGTIMVYPLNPDREFKNIQYLTPVKDGFVFQADTKAEGRELWFSDGTFAGTHPISNRPLTYVGAQINDIIPMPGNPQQALVAFETAATGTELFITDGTSEGTRPFVDLVPGPIGSQPSRFMQTESGRVRFFVLLPTGQALYETDGTQKGTVLVSRIRLGTTRSSNPRFFVDLPNESLFFFAIPDCKYQSEPHAYDIASGKITRLVDTPPVATTGSSGIAIEIKDGVVFFMRNDLTNGAELWRSDGTTAGTYLVKDINPGIASSFTGYVQGVTVNGNILFFVDDGEHGYEPYLSDGTAQGTRLLKDLVPGSVGSDGYELASLDAQRAVFVTRINSGRAQLWITDGTATGTIILHDASGLSQMAPTILNQRVYFLGADSKGDRELWSTDGTIAGTGLLIDLNPSGSSSPSIIAKLGSRILFRANTAAGSGLWTSDGTSIGTVPILDSVAKTPFFASILAVVGENALLSRSTSPAGSEPWWLNAAASSAELVYDIVPGPTGSSPNVGYRFGDGAFFSALEENRQRRLWWTDGTAASTKRAFTMDDFQSTTAQYVTDNLVLISGSRSATGEELYILSKDDKCPADPQKIVPGACGCGKIDLDQDHDGGYDCLQDQCSSDPDKLLPGLCGCGRRDDATDATNNGVPDCLIKKDLLAELNKAFKAIRKLKFSGKPIKQKKVRAAIRLSSSVISYVTKILQTLPLPRQRKAGKTLKKNLLSFKAAQDASSQKALLSGLKSTQKAIRAAAI